MATALPTSNFSVEPRGLRLLAFSAAAHDIASDGFYMLGLQQHPNKRTIGILFLFHTINDHPDKAVGWSIWPGSSPG